MFQKSPDLFAMKLHFLPFLAAINLVNAGWKLDRSCKKDDGMYAYLLSLKSSRRLTMRPNIATEELVARIVTDAFSMASYGRTAVDNIFTGTQRNRARY
jgi:hypothetical protein